MMITTRAEEARDRRDYLADALLDSAPVFDRAGLMDRTKIGTLDVPNLALGTIAWNVKGDKDGRDFAMLARTAAAEGMNLFDTAERYGASGTSLIPASLKAMGLPVKKADLGGDTETRLGEWLEDSGTVMTKFAP